MPHVTFRHGNPVNIDYTHATTAITEGTVVVIGTVTANTGGAGAFTGIAPRPIANAELSSLMVGGGVYDVVNLNNAANGAKVYWDASTNKVTSVSTNNAVFGQIVSSGAGGANSTARAFHNPWFGGA